MEPVSQPRKMLALHGSTVQSEGVLSSLRGAFEIHEVGDLKAAVEAMRRTPFDVVLAETSDFLPLERAMAQQQTAAVLDTLGEGVCLVNARGEMVWANRRLRQFSEELLRELRDVCVRAFETIALAKLQDAERTKRFSILTESGAYFEVICSPVYDREGVLRQVVGVVIDATRQRRQQLRLNAIERAGHELVRLDTQSLKPGDTQGRLKLLEERILRCSRDVLHFEHVAVLLLDAKTNRLNWLVNMGLDNDVAAREYFASTENNGICGYVAATGHSYLCPDVQRDPRYIRGLADARSSLTVPLRLHDRVIGVLNAESRDGDAFGEDERQFAEMFADHVAMTLHVLDLLVSERHSASTEVSGSINARLAGPLSDIITETSNLMEDYIGHDDLRPRLQSIIDLATAARSSAQRAADETRYGVQGIPADLRTADRTDPVLAGRKILVVDDEELIRKIIRDVLTTFGCEVDAAADGREAIEKMQRQRYDLVLSDIRMPEADGYEVFSSARRLDPKCPVVLMTGFGYDPNHAVVRAHREGLSAILYKPFKINTLLETIRSAILAGR